MPPPTHRMYNGSSEIVPFPSQQVAVVNVTGGSTNNVIVTGVAGQRVVVLSGWIATGTTNSSFLFEGSGGTALTGIVPMPVWTIFPLDPPDGIMVIKAPAGESLRMDVGAGDLDGWLVYVMVQAQ